MSIFADRLRRLRTIKNEKQQVVADELKIPRNSLSNYENGLREPCIDMIITLADYYNASADYLFGREDVVYNNTDDCTDLEKDILNDLVGLNSVSQEKVKEYIRLLKLDENNNE